jgi:predicted nuclease of predicted toxin-antitoxin system
VKLLLDANVSHKLDAAIADLFPGSAHVRDVRMQRADDVAIWDLAKVQGFVIVTKDADFHQRSFLHGHPPKVLWLRTGNCSTAEIEAILRRAARTLVAFEADDSAACLVLS